MTPFVWPSDQDRADNDELNRVCEHLEEAIDELTELAAHVDQLTLALKDARLSLEHARVFISSRQKMHQAGAEGHEDSIAIIYLALKNTPTTSLAKRDLIKQAEILELISGDVKSMNPKASPTGIGVHIGIEAKKLRQQAKELSQ